MDDPRFHLPVDHPEFLYSGTRNPYFRKIGEIGSPRAFADQASEAQKGRWREKFSELDPSAPRTELHVELGCNAGHVTIEWSARNPSAAFIGLDWKYKVVHRAAEKAVKRGLRNVIFVRAYAERLEYIFAPGEIDHLYLFFPDPWPKKRHWKNRFVTAKSLELAARLVRPGGTFEIKTDHPGYFEWMEDELAKLQKRFWDVTERSVDLHRSHPNPTALDFPNVTLFEKLFIQDKIPIHRLKLVRLAGEAEGDPQTGTTARS